MTNKTLILALIGASSVALLAGGVSQAQSFGGMPTITQQDAKKRSNDATSSQQRRDTKKPAYVVVDKGGPQGGRDRHVYTSINEAINSVAWGGVVVVMPGTYTENVVLKNSVSVQGDRGAGQSVIIRPTDGSKPCLSFQPKHFNDHAMVSNITFKPSSSATSHFAGSSAGASLTNASAAAEPCVDVQGGIFTMVESTVDGGGAHKGDLINIAGGTVLLEKNKISGGMRGISVNQEHALWDRTLLVDNIVSNNQSDGIHLAGVASMLATGNLVNNNRGVGISYDGSGAATIVGNKILNNHDHGVELARGGRQVLARLNQIWANDGSGIHVVNTSGLIEDNDIDGNAKYEISTQIDGHLDTMPTIINDVAINKPSPRRGGWGINKPGKR